MRLAHSRLPLAQKKRGLPSSLLSSIGWLLGFNLLHPPLPPQTVPLVPLHQLDVHAAPDHCGGPLQAADRDVVVRVEQPVHLGAARLQQRRHLVLGDVLLLHGLRELLRDDILDRLRLRFLEDAFLLQEGIDARSHMRLAHRSNSF